MRCSTYAVLTGLLTVAPVAALAGAPGPGSNGVPPPLVFRADQVDGVATGRAVGGLTVPVLRGDEAAADGVVAPSPAVRESVPVAAASPPSADGWRVAAGEKLWFVDPGTGRVIACRERDTATIGRRAIECVGRRLQALDP